MNTSLEEMRSDQLWTTISRFYMEKRDVLLRDVGRLELEGLLTWKREESAREKTMALHADQMRSIPGGPASPDPIAHLERAAGGCVDYVSDATGPARIMDGHGVSTSISGRSSKHAATHSHLRCEWA